MMDIKVIGRESCGQCKSVKSVLGNKGVAYTTVDFDTLSAENRREYMERARCAKSIGLPIIEIGEEVVSVYDLMRRIGNVGGNDKW